MSMGSASQTRRQRGYAWERTIARRFQKEGWKAVRLGSPSIELPDVMAVSDRFSTIFAIEAKSGAGTTLYVPRDQVFRCIDWVRMFGKYTHREFILAFKFLGKKRMADGTHVARERKEYFFTGTRWWIDYFNESEIDTIACTYEGETYGIAKGERVHDERMQMGCPFNNPADKRVHTYEMLSLGLPGGIPLAT